MCQNVSEADARPRTPLGAHSHSAPLHSIAGFRGRKRQGRKKGTGGEGDKRRKDIYTGDGAGCAVLKTPQKVSLPDSTSQYSDIRLSGSESVTGESVTGSHHYFR